MIHMTDNELLEFASRRLLTSWLQDESIDCSQHLLVFIMTHGDDGWVRLGSRYCSL